MFALFEEAGKFVAGRVLDETPASSQVELDSGKRVKVKAANVLLRFDKPAPAEMLRNAHALGQSIELELAWEFAPEDEFGFAELAQDYFSSDATRPASLEQQAGTLLRLYEAPHYFRRAGKGRFRKAGAEVLAQALAAIEKKRQIALQVSQWAQQLLQGQCPAPIREQLYKILFKPDKNAPEYRAVVEASRSSHRAPLELLQHAGAIDSPYQFHWRRFLLENFPRGTAFAPVAAPAIAESLPLAPARAFSIDDSATTEIDDALSLQGLGSGSVVLGIHIAAPALALAPGDALDQIARSRLSTVYMPGHKLTMLPDAVIQSYTLREGCNCPAVSLYLTLDEATLELRGFETRLERVAISANLRHDQLDAVVTARWLQEPDFQGEAQPPALVGLRPQLSFLHRLALHLKAGRERVRGKPELFNRPDYNFRLQGRDGAEPDGTEQVEISVRLRGAPLDLIVAEAMILANSTWGGWLAELGVPAIYRSQASLAPGVKVRMGTKALPHAGIGVKSYCWSTSPLRRYTDLVNQWQIIACARHGKTAALAAPFKPKDAELFSIVSSFDAAYFAYNSFQNTMERFWTLKAVQQQALRELDASVIKEGLVRCDNLPLVLLAAGARDLPRGARVRIALGSIDEMTLDLSGRVIARLDEPGGSAAGSGDDAAAVLSEDDDEAIAGPVAIALEVSEEAVSGDDNPVS